VGPQTPSFIPQIKRSYKSCYTLLRHVQGGSMSASSSKII